MQNFSFTAKGSFVIEQIETRPSWTLSQCSRIIYEKSTQQHWIGSNSNTLGHNGWIPVNLNDDIILSNLLEWNTTVDPLNLTGLSSLNIPIKQDLIITNVQDLYNFFNSTINSIIDGTGINDEAIVNRHIDIEANDIPLVNGAADFIDESKIEHGLNQIYEWQADHYLMDPAGTFGDLIPSLLGANIQFSLEKIESFLDNLDSEDFISRLKVTDTDHTIQYILDDLYSRILNLRLSDIIIQLQTCEDDQYLITDGVDTISIVTLNAKDIVCQFPNDEYTTIQIALYNIESILLYYDNTYKSHIHSASEILYQDKINIQLGEIFTNVDLTLDYLLSHMFTNDNKLIAESFVCDPPLASNVQLSLDYLKLKLVELNSRFPCQIQCNDIFYNSPKGTKDLCCTLDYIFENCCGLPPHIHEQYYTIPEIDSIEQQLINIPIETGGTGGTGSDGPDGDIGATLGRCEAPEADIVLLTSIDCADVVCAAQFFLFEVNVTTTSTEPLQYQWNFEGGITSDPTTMDSINIKWMNSGIYNVRVQVNTGALISVADKSITVVDSPVIVISHVEPLSGKVGHTVRFNTNLSVLPAGSNSRVWRINGVEMLDYGGFSHIDPQFTFNDIGSHTVSVSVNTPCGEVSSEKIVNISDQFIVTFNVRPACVNNPIHFTAEASGYEGSATALTYHWIAPDGVITSSSEKTCFVTYPTPGVKTLTVNVTDNNGTTVGVFNSVDVYPLPEAHISVLSGDPTGPAPMEITFDSTSSSKSPTDSMQWWFDGVPYNDRILPGSTLDRPKFRFEVSDAHKSVYLSITSICEGITSTSSMITIDPTTDFTVELTDLPSIICPFAEYVIRPIISGTFAAPLSYYWETTDDTTGDLIGWIREEEYGTFSYNESITISTTRAGTFRATLTVTDATGISKTVYKVFTGVGKVEAVLNIPPEQSVIFTVPQTLYVTSENSIGPDGVNQGITARHWYVDDMPRSETGNEIIVVFDEYSAGEHTVTCQIDSACGSDDATMRFTALQNNLAYTTFHFRLWITSRINPISIPTVSGWTWLPNDEGINLVWAEANTGRIFDQQQMPNQNFLYSNYYYSTNTLYIGIAPGVIMEMVPGSFVFEHDYIDFTQYDPTSMACDIGIFDFNSPDVPQFSQVMYLTFTNANTPFTNIEDLFDKWCPNSLSDDRRELQVSFKVKIRGV